MSARRGCDSGDRLVSLPAGTVAAALDRLARDRTPQAILELAMRQGFCDRIALVSSFGAESAALLHMVAQIDRATPVLFLQTGMLFAETLAYQQALAARLGLGEVRLIRPDPQALAQADPAGRLHASDPDACCHLRKTAPLKRALEPFDAWITGRKRYQSAARAGLAVFEADADGRIKVNPLTGWDARAVREYMSAHDLPLHPLVHKGYPSIGCAPCTTPVAPGEDARAGRWRDRVKLECGIHLEGGRARRSA